MIYHLKAILEDIKTDNSDSYELHFDIINEDSTIRALLKNDFVFILNNNEWVVSANDKNTISHAGFHWYIRGSQKQQLGDKHYYQNNKEHFHKKEFNNELRQCAPLIQNNVHNMIFDTDTNRMSLI